MNRTNENPKTKIISATSKEGTTKLMVGPALRGPKRCLVCGKPFKNGEAWHRITSPADPDLGSYSIGIHDKCASK